MQNNDALYSTMVRAGRTTYFVDVRKAKNGNKYLSISESRLDGDDKKQRMTVRVFGDTIEQFRQAVDEATVAMRQTTAA
jgi:hypothetical protein